MPNGAKPGQVSPQVIDTMAMAYAGCVFVLAIVLVLIVRRFPITREQHEARLQLLGEAARSDPEATGHHP
jgi:GPH family glycoside/pentoside/hexuronide:cation symporter